MLRALARSSHTYRVLPVASIFFHSSGESWMLAAAMFSSRWVMLAIPGNWQHHRTN
jgi:hypothetical protein